MQKYLLKVTNNWTVLVTVILFSIAAHSQSTTNSQPSPKNPFWEKVHFGGGLGLSFGNNSTNITIAPSAIYSFNEYVSAGVGLQYSYLKQRDLYTSNLYGGSLIALFNPIKEIQLSTELEEMSVNNTYTSGSTTYKDSFWNTALFVGAGYRANNVTIGARYNVLYNKDKDVYGSAFMPFVRVYF